MTRRDHDRPRQRGELGGPAGRLRRRAAIRAGCQCQRYKMRPRESWASVGSRRRSPGGCASRPPAVTRSRRRRPASSPISMASPSVGARSSRARHYPRLLLKTRVPWEGGAEDKTDDSVWAVTCFVTRAGFRRRGVSLGARPGRRRLRPRARRPRARGLSDGDRGGPGMTLGELHVGSRSIFGGRRVTVRSAIRASARLRDARSTSRRVTDPGPPCAGGYGRWRSGASSWQRPVGREDARAPVPRCDGRATTPTSAHDERPGRLPRRRAGRLVCGRAADRVPAPAAQDARPVGRRERGRPTTASGP